jgi:hypothetical protein
MLTVCSSTLTSDDAADLLLMLIERYLDALRNGNTSLVAKKLATALATFFINFNQVWERFIHHLVLCLVSDQPYAPNALNDAPGLASLLERTSPPKLQAVLWVLGNVLDEVAKFNLNTPQKCVSFS